MRNSDADATLYWLARMLESGEDPLYVARRLVRMASEDIGLADPAALGIAVAAMQAADFVRNARRQSQRWLRPRCISRSRRNRMLFTQVTAEAQKRLRRKTTAEPVPLHLRSAVTGLMREVGYGRGYQYAHDDPEKVTYMTCLPDNLAGRRYYQPGDQGFEQRLRARMEEIRRITAQRAAKAK